MAKEKKKQVFLEIEELLSDNKKATEIFQRIKRREEYTQKISRLIIFIMFIEIILSILVFGFCMNLNLLPEIAGIPLLIIMVALFLVVLYLSDKNHVTFLDFYNEINFINGILKEKGRCIEAELIPSGEQQYAEVYDGKNLRLICVDNGNTPEKIESCLICYYKKIHLSTDCYCIFILDKYRIFGKYQEKLKLIKEN